MLPFFYPLSNRDYLKGKTAHSWLYLSRLAAIKEFAFMRALEEHGFPVPRAIDNNRHAVLMSKVDGCTMVQMRKFRNPSLVYQQSMELIERIAGVGLIHCDLNEFNLLVNEESEEVTLIDFPQMVSVSHPNAEMLFNRDVECVIRFFKKKIGYLPEEDEALGGRIRPDFAEVAGKEGSLDAQLAASGFKKEHQKALEEFVGEDAGSDSDGASSEAAEDSGAEESESDEEDAEDSRVGSGDEAGPAPVAALQAFTIAEPAATAERRESAATEGAEAAEGSGSESESESGDDAKDAARREAVHQRVLDEARKRMRREAMGKATRNANKKGSGRAKAANAAFHGGY